MLALEAIDLSGPNLQIGGRGGETTERRALFRTALFRVRAGDASLLKSKSHGVVADKQKTSRRSANSAIIPPLSTVSMVQRPQLTLSNSFTNALVGSAPTPNQYRILSTFHSTFFSFCAWPRSVPNTFADTGSPDGPISRGIGSYSPNFSSGRASRRFEALMATMW